MFSVPTFILLVLIYFNLDTHASQSSDGVDDVSTLVFTNVVSNFLSFISIQY